MYDRRRQRAASAVVSSPANEQVRFVKSLYRGNVRRKEGLFVVEGVRLLEDALNAQATPELLLVDPEQLDRTPRGAALHARVNDLNPLVVTDSVLKSVSDTVTPQGVIAVFKIPAAPAVTVSGPVVLILDSVRDPGNAGTILRSADASGVVRVVAFVNSVDAYAPKVVRAGMGAHFRLAILDGSDWTWLRPRLADRPIYLAAASDGDAYDAVDWSRPSAIILGGEAEGASAAAEAVATRRITIPMAGPTESLNAAMAGTVILFEVARERRAGRVRSTAAPATAAERPTPSEQRRPGPPAPARKDRERDGTTRSPRGHGDGRTGRPPRDRAPDSAGSRGRTNTRGKGPGRPATTGESPEATAERRRPTPSQSRAPRKPRTDASAPERPFTPKSEHQSFGTTRRRPKL